MALPRVCASISRSFLVRGSPRIASTAFLSARVVAGTVPQRQFTSSTLKFQEISQDSAATSESAQPERIVDRSKNARTLILKQIPKHLTPAQIEKLFKDAGLNIESLDLQFNRFTYQSATLGYVTLANEQEVQQAIAKLGKDKSTAPFYISQVRPDFWTSDTDTNLGQMSNANADGIAQAIAPLMEQRRVVFSVLPPGWANLKQKVRERNDQNRSIILRNLSKYGLESVGRASTNWGDRKKEPRFLMFVDFSTKEGAEQAIRELHNTEMEGFTVGLRISTLSPQKAYMIGQLDRTALEALQEKGLAPTVNLSKGIEQFKKNKIDVRADEQA